MQSPRGEAQPLPGLGDPPPAIGEVETAARATLAALDAGDLLDPAHAIITQTLVTIARQVDRAVSSPSVKAYAVAQLVGQLRDTWADLPAREEDTDNDPWSELEAQFRQAAARDTTQTRRDD